MAFNQDRKNVKLGSDVNRFFKLGSFNPKVINLSPLCRILFVRNLPYAITAEEMYDLFGKYGGIRQIRLGNENTTKGTAYVGKCN
jgi:RNA recognition motif-containing protein